MKIIVSVGHTLTGKGSGAIGILNESVINREVASLVKNHLQKQGHNVVYLQIDKIGDKDPLDYVQRANQANKYPNYDLFVEIHHNCFNGTAQGTEVFYYSDKGKVYAQKIANSIAELGFYNRGAKYYEWHVLKATKMPAVLVECCFIDNKSDVSKHNSDKIARKIVKGITGVEPVDKPVSTSPAKEEKAPAGQYYRVQLGAYTYKKYAEEMLEKLKKAGFTDAFIKLS